MVPTDPCTGVPPAIFFNLVANGTQTGSGFVSPATSVAGTPQFDALAFGTFPNSPILPGSSDSRVLSTYSINLPASCCRNLFVPARALVQVIVQNTGTSPTPANTTFGDVSLTISAGTATATGTTPITVVPVIPVGSQATVLVPVAAFLNTRICGATTITITATVRNNSTPTTGTVNMTPSVSNTGVTGYSGVVMA